MNRTKAKATSLLVIASLLASALLISHAMAVGFTPGAGTKFFIQFEAPYTNATSGNLFVTGPPPSIGQKFNVSMYISNVTEMIGYVSTLVWYHNVCQATGGIWDYNVWGAPGAQLLGFSYVAPYNYSYVGILDSAANGLKATGYSYNLTTVGPVKLYTIEFIVVSFGFSPMYIVKTNNGAAGTEQEVLLVGMLLLSPSGWMNPTTQIGQSEPYDVVWLVPPPAPCYNGAIIIYPPPPYAPQATKTKNPASPKEGETVDITVTETLAGFNGSAINHISSVTIDYGDGSALNTSAFTPPSIHFYHAYGVAGPYTIKVYCFAANQPAGLEWCNLTNPITIIELALTGIDVYELRDGEKSGEGKDIPGRPYDPQSLVTLVAYVQYNGDPVQCKIVSFEVRWECEECILYRTDLTGDDPDDPMDADGIAWIEFRIPSVCWDYGGPEALMGKWCVIVTVEMCEVKFNDTLWFDMGWILTLSDMVVNTPTVKKCELVSFNVTVTNIDWIATHAHIILVVYDDNEVPIGQEIIELDVPAAEGFCNPYVVVIEISLHIPKYAYVGSERPIGYINCFTALPFECGLAWCPEVSCRFVILAG